MKNLTDIATIIHYKLGITTDAAEGILETYVAQMEQVDGRDIDRDAITEDDADFLIEAAGSGQRAGDYGHTELAALEEVAEEFDAAETTYRAVMSRRDQAIRAALDAGARVTDTAAAGHVTRARVDQIRKAGQ